jgi:hypothetical protein
MTCRQLLSQPRRKFKCIFAWLAQVREELAKRFITQHGSDYIERQRVPPQLLNHRTSNCKLLIVVGLPMGREYLKRFGGLKYSQRDFCYERAVLATSGSDQRSCRA